MPLRVARAATRFSARERTHREAHLPLRSPFPLFSTVGGIGRRRRFGHHLAAPAAGVGWRRAWPPPTAGGWGRSRGGVRTSQGDSAATNGPAVTNGAGMRSCAQLFQRERCRGSGANTKSTATHGAASTPTCSSARPLVRGANGRGPLDGEFGPRGAADARERACAGSGQPRMWWRGRGANHGGGRHEVRHGRGEDG
jgi:hypothetical protein